MFSLFTKKVETAPDVLALQSEMQSMRLELAERDKTVARLQSDLERMRGEAEFRSKNTIEKLGKDVAGSMAQLLAQAYLLEKEGKPVQAKDVLAVARKLLRGLAENGITIESEAGSAADFDPNKHEPLSVETKIEQGRPIIVRLPSIACHGVIIRKAGVNPS